MERLGTRLGPGSILQYRNTEPLCWWYFLCTPSDLMKNGQYDLTCSIGIQIQSHYDLINNGQWSNLQYRSTEPLHWGSALLVCPPPISLSSPLCHTTAVLLHHTCHHWTGYLVCQLPTQSDQSWSLWIKPTSLLCSCLLGVPILSHLLYLRYHLTLIPKHMFIGVLHVCCSCSFNQREHVSHSIQHNVECPCHLRIQLYT